jgi:hypothetical protein
MIDMNIPRFLATARAYLLGLMPAPQRLPATLPVTISRRPGR